MRNLGPDALSRRSVSAGVIGPCREFASPAMGGIGSRCVGRADGFASRVVSRVVPGGVAIVGALDEGDGDGERAVESPSVAALAVLPSVAFAAAVESVDDDLESTQAQSPISPMITAELEYGSIWPRHWSDLSLARNHESRLLDLLPLRLKFVDVALSHYLSRSASGNGIRISRCWIHHVFHVSE